MVKRNYVVVIQLVNKLQKFLGDLLSHWNLTNEIFDEIVRCCTNKLLLLLLNDTFSRDHSLHKLSVVGD